MSKKNREEIEINLKEFNMNWITGNKVIVFIGKRGTGRYCPSFLASFSSCATSSSKPAVKVGNFKLCLVLALSSPISPINSPSLDLIIAERSRSKGAMAAWLMVALG